MYKKLLGIPVVFLLIGAIFASAFLYKNSFTGYFFQDDWFSLRISEAKSLGSFLNFFVPRGDVVYFRPLGMQVPFYIIKNLFGISPLMFHVFGFLTHTLNIILVFLLIKMLTKSIFESLLVSFFYATSAVHYTVFYWSATYAFLLGPTFFLLSFFLVIRKHLYLPILLFILGLLTNEILVIFPVILLFYFLYIKSKNIKIIIPFVVIDLIYLFFRLINPLPQVSGNYEVGLNISLVNNLKAYLLWSFNWPEEMKAQFITFFRVNPKFIEDFPLYFEIFLGSFIIMVFLFYVFPALIFLKKKNIYFSKFLLFCGGWFLVGLSPVLFFSKHSFSYYLPISLIGLLIFSVSAFSVMIMVLHKQHRYLSIFLVILLCLTWIGSSWGTIDFNSKIHWAPRRAKISKNLIDKAIKDNPISDVSVQIENTSENKLALNDQDALKIIFNNENFVTNYK